ncbi:kinase-like protein [Neocallimastix sp. 'constans']
MNSRNNNLLVEKIITLVGNEGSYSFKEDDIIGEGTFGKTYKASISDHSFVVLKKKVIRCRPYDFYMYDLIQREFLLLQPSNHDNVTRMIDFIYPESDPRSFVKEFYIIKEYGDTNLKNFINKYENGLPSNLIHKYLIQILKGLVYLHSEKNIIHGNLKPENIIIFKYKENYDEKDYFLKITDFDIDNKKILPIEDQFDDEITDALLYKAPEVLLKLDFNISSVDIWSVGCIFYEMKIKKVIWN